MTAWLERSWRSQGFRLLSSSAAVFLVWGQSAAMASRSPELKTYPVMATGLSLPEPTLRELEIPPLGNPSEFFPEEEIFPEVTPQEESTPPEANAQENRIHLVLNLSDRRVYVYEGEQISSSYPVAVGKPGWETPTGEFAVLDKALDPVWENPWTGEVIESGPQSPIGPAIVVFILDESGMFAFHGTPNEELIGQAVSHGCVRLRNEDILALYEQVDITTPVVVVP